MDTPHNIRVLLVDDEKDFADTLAKRLEVRDFVVNCVYNGDDAITRVKSGRDDVVLLDVLMPGKSGLDILKEMKAINPLIHIIMLTGHARVDTAIEGMELGAYDYLIKPTETEELVEKIRLAYSHKATESEKLQRSEPLNKENRAGWGRKLIKSFSRLFQKGQPDDVTVNANDRKKGESNHSDA